MSNKVILCAKHSGSNEHSESTFSVSGNEPQETNDPTSTDENCIYCKFNKLVDIMEDALYTAEGNAEETDYHLIHDARDRLRELKEKE